MQKQIISLAVLLSVLTVETVNQASAESTPVVKPVIAKVCTNCHKAQQGALRGTFENVSFKSKAIQMRMDDSVEVVNFDRQAIQVINDERKIGNGDLLDKNGIRKGHEILIEYTERSGIKTATKIIAKPPVDIPSSMLISTDEVAALIKKGSGYYLYDSRPSIRFQEGSIPTAINLPYPSFDKLAEKLLPPDKNALIIFYCAGVTCNMSPASAEKAKKLGYSNIKVYRDGMPAWSSKHFSVISSKDLKEGWIDKGLSYVLLDLRTEKESALGFIKGAVAFPAISSNSLVNKITLKYKKAPIVLYDARSGSEAAGVAEKLLKAGYGNVRILTDGFEGWKSAGYELANGSLEKEISYVPKLRQGEIEVDEFKKIAHKLPKDVVIVDVRTAEDVEKGMLKSAINIPLPDLREKASNLPKDKMIVLQCNTGNQAEMAYHLLKEFGFVNIKFLNAKIKVEKNGQFELTKE